MIDRSATAKDSNCGAHPPPKPNAMEPDARCCLVFMPVPEAGLQDRNVPDGGEGDIAGLGKGDQDEWRNDQSVQLPEVRDAVEHGPWMCMPRDTRLEPGPLGAVGHEHDCQPGFFLVRRNPQRPGAHADGGEQLGEGGALLDTVHPDRFEMTPASPRPKERGHIRN